jgi:hypothetical protein
MHISEIAFQSLFDVFVIKNTVITQFKMSSPSPPKFQKLSQDWNADLLQLFESGELYDCTLKVGRDDLESGCKVCNNYYVTTFMMSGLFCRSSSATQ